MTVSSLPSNIGSGEVFGKLMDSDGNPIRGKVIFYPRFEYLTNQTGDTTPVLILPKSRAVEIHEDGRFAIELLATDDEDNNPTGWTWGVEFQLKDGYKLKPFDIHVLEGESKDLSEILPVSVSQGILTVQGPPGKSINVILVDAQDWPPEPDSDPNNWYVRLSNA